MDSKIGFEMSLMVVPAIRGTMCEFHDSNGNGFEDIWWTDKLINFSRRLMGIGANFYVSGLDVHCLIGSTLTTCTTHASTATSYCHMTLACPDNTPYRKTGEFSLDLSKMPPVHIVTSIIWHLKRHLLYGGYLYRGLTKFNRTILRCVKFKRAMLSNVLTAK